MAPSTGATKQVKVSTGSWAVELCIPFLAFGAGVVPTTKWSAALCRYNYGPGEDGRGNIVKEGDSGKGGKEELSSAAQFVTFKKGYHTWEEFTDLDFRAASI